MDGSPAAPPAEGPPPNLYGMDREGLAAALAPFAPRPFHAGQVYHWMYGRQETRFEAMTDLPVALRRALARATRIAWPSVKEVRASVDGSRKYVLRLEDGGEIEAVYIVHGSRITLCLSSQIGCPLDCRFCLTGTMGLIRNLSPGEIAGQAAVLVNEHRIDRA